jgi:hypothetical protein
VKKIDQAHSAVEATSEAMIEIAAIGDRDRQIEKEKQKQEQQQR